MFRSLLLVTLLAGSVPKGFAVQPADSPDVQTVKIVLPNSHQQPPPFVSLPAPVPINRGFVEPVAFSAVHASSSTRRSVSKILFDNTVTDIGYGWYADRSEFICYYPGVYFFTFSALSTPNSQFKVALMRNSDEIVATWGEQTGFHAGSNSAILNLNKNDRVFLSIQEGQIHDSRITTRGYTTLSGFRIN